MFEAKKAVSLFPTTLWLFQIPAEVHGRINAELKRKLNELIAAASDENHEGGWQTEHDLHTLPEMQELTVHFLNAVDDVLDAITTTNRNVKITGCWANIGPPGSGHDSHLHPNNFLSAVYYVSVPMGGHQITFWDPRHQTRIMAPPVNETNVTNSDYANMQVQEGMLILFPSWLVHSVPENAGNDTRISISFNINFTDFSDDISAPNWQPDLPTHPEG
jgi:uncharacterized protein (TIGR02466 family)